MFTIASCGGQSEAPLPALPEGFDDRSLVDSEPGKPDWITKWLAEIQGTIGFDTAVTGTTSYSEWFHGYTFDLKAGDTIALKAYGSTYGLARIYGPLKKGGSWGWAQKNAWITWDHSEQVYRGGFSGYTAIEEGSYQLVVGSPWTSTYEYDMILGCPSGHCGNKFCVVYDTVDPSGNPLQNTYAINVSTYEEGKQLLAKVSNFINEDILTGACDQVLMACPKVYMPVCASTPDTDLQTFGNVCNFKAFVRQEAGSEGEAKGHWEDGTCKCDPTTEWWRKYVSTDPATCQVLKFYCQPNTNYFSNDCGCGCEQSKSCEKTYDCEPPTDCSAIMAECPYSTFAL
jgi:hypothetical protein